MTLTINAVQIQKLHCTYMVSLRDSISSCAFHMTQNIIQLCDTPTSGHVRIYFSFSHIIS